MLKINELSRLYLGVKGENNSRTIEIDMSAWASIYPNATAVILHKRSGDQAKELTGATYDSETKVLQWKTSSTDTFYDGFGVAEVRMVENNVVKKTKDAITTVTASSITTASGDVLESNYQAFLNAVTAQATAAGTAKTGAETAQGYAEAAQAAAEAAILLGPYVDETTGNWFVWDWDDEEYKDTGVHAQGDKGAAGADGRDGSDGQDGFSPTASVTKSGKVATISITDKNGTTTTTVSDGEDADPTTIIDDTAGDGATNKVWSADKSYDEKTTLLSALQQNTPELYGAKGDGVTDDSQAVQDAIDAGYAVYFASNKTYYIASEVTIDHDCHLFGGKNTKIITKTPSGGTVNNAFVASGTLKKTTVMTTNYTSNGTTDNAGNQFTLSDMTDIDVGDIMVITAEDQYYSYARPTYYLGAVLLISDIYNSHIYTSNSMPWDITNSQDVSVKIYSAPTVIIENLTFVSDMDSLGSYKSLIDLKWCKNSIVRNCNLSQMAIGLRLNFCVNTLVDCVTVSKSKYDNSLTGDGYGIYVQSSSDTIIQRVLAICAQGCVDLGGTIPNINTIIRNCNLTSECRAIGIDMHENSYNIVVEDCTFGGLSLFGTASVNRCRFIRNNRSDSAGNAIIFRGNHNPEWAKLNVSNCLIDGDMIVAIDKPIPQSAVQSFDNVIGSIVISGCENGRLTFNPSTDSDVTSNIIKSIVIRDWKNCDKFYHTSGNVVEYMKVDNCTFKNKYWATDNNNSHGVYLDYIRYLDYSSAKPLTHKIHVDSSVMGSNIVLPKNVSIALSSSNSSTAKYVVCGVNITSDNINDYFVGSITGSVGSALSRTIATSQNKPTIALNSNGDIVYSQGSTTSNYSLCPIGMVYASEFSTYSVSATIKNTGATNGVDFYPYIAIVNCDTGKVVYRSNGTKKTTSAEGVAISHSYLVEPNCVVVGYFYCSTAIASAETTFEDLKFELTPCFAPAVVNEPYNGKRMTGDGTITSIDGVNNIMSFESSFNVKIDADYVNNPIGLLQSGEGVSF